MYFALNTSKNRAYMENGQEISVVLGSMSSINSFCY